MILTNPACYVLNTATVGDVIASLPVLQYVIQNIHTTGKYKVACYDFIKDLVKLVVPETNISILDKENTVFDEPYWIRYYIPQNLVDGHFFNGNSIVPNHMSLTEYASITFLRRCLQDLSWPVYKPVPSLLPSAKPYIVILPCFSASTRQFPSETIKELINIYKKQKVDIVLLGQVGSVSDSFKYSMDEVVSKYKVINWINKTTLAEAAFVMSQARSVIGFDGGMIHLSALVRAKTVAVYTVVPSKYRKPPVENFIALDARCDCAGCSDIQVENWDFQYCPDGSYRCCKSITAQTLYEAANSL